MIIKDNIAHWSSEESQLECPLGKQTKLSKDEKRMLWRQMSADMVYKIPKTVRQKMFLKQKYACKYNKETIE